MLFFFFKENSDTAKIWQLSQTKMKIVYLFISMKKMSKMNNPCKNNQNGSSLFYLREQIFFKSEELLISEWVYASQISFCIWIYCQADVTWSDLESQVCYLCETGKATFNSPRLWEMPPKMTDNDLCLMVFMPLCNTLTPTGSMQSTYFE